MSEETREAQGVQNEQKTVTFNIPEVLAMLEAGKTREQIAEELGITMKVCREVLFAHPDLKGKRSRRKKVTTNYVFEGTNEALTEVATPAEETEEVTTTEAFNVTSEEESDTVEDQNGAEGEGSGSDVWED